MKFRQKIKCCNLDRMPSVTFSRPKCVETTFSFFLVLWNVVKICGSIDLDSYHYVLSVDKLIIYFISEISRVLIWFFSICWKKKKCGNKLEKKIWEKIRNNSKYSCLVLKYHHSTEHACIHAYWNRITKRLHKQNFLWNSV